MPCTSDPEWEAPLDAEIEKDSAHVARIGDHAGAAERLRQEIDDQEAESRAQAMLDAHAALLDEEPTLKYFVVGADRTRGCMASSMRPRSSNR